MPKPSTWNGSGENERLRALVDGVEIPDLVTSDHSEASVESVEVATPAAGSGS